MQATVRYAQLGDLRIGYELIGTGPPVAITPGGRFPMSTGGVRELAVEIADAGYQVLIWDRPNCGLSSVSFDAGSESELWSNALAALIRELDLGPTVLLGGSAGSRVSLLTAARHPDVVRMLYLWWISGGDFGLMTLGVHYIGDCLMAVARAGMPAVAKLAVWSESIEAVPTNRDLILAQDPVEFRATMETWCAHYRPPEGSPIPGMTLDDFAGLAVPVQILRSGESDVHHPKRTSEQVHALIPKSRISEPPWGDNEWNERSHRSFKGESLFAGWPLLAPGVLDFLATNSSITKEAVG